MPSFDGQCQYREEKEKEEKGRYLAALRIAIRNSFADQAKQESKMLEDAVNSISDGALKNALDELVGSA
jgi:hypothetical protein